MKTILDIILIPQQKQKQRNIIFELFPQRIRTNGKRDKLKGTNGAEFAVFR